MNYKIIVIASFFMTHVIYSKVKRPYYDVKDIIWTLSDIPWSKKTETENGLLIALRDGFAFYQGWLHEYLMFQNIRSIAQNCQSVPPALMAYLVSNISLSEQGVAHICPVTEFNERELRQKYVELSDHEIGCVKYLLDHNQQANCESCDIFAQFLNRQKEIIKTQRDLKDEQEAAQARETLKKLLK